MKKRSRAHIATPLLTATILLSTNASAQFNKFKSSSENLNPQQVQPMNGEMPEQFVEDPEALTPEEEEMLGDYEDYQEPEVFNEAPPAPGNSGPDTSRSRNFGRNNNKAFGNDESSANVSTFGKRTNTMAGKPQTDKFVTLNPETAFGPEIVTSFDFPETDILDLTRHMQQLTGINLILDKDVKGKVSITAPTAITVGDAWKAYLAALNMAGYTLVKSGAFYKVMNARDVRYVPTTIYTGSYTPDTEAHIMKIIALKNVDAGEISRNFRPFMSRYGRIIDIKQTNTIIISDTGSNIARLETLIKFLDVPGHEEVLQIIPVKNSSAQEIAKLLDEILKDDSSAGRSSRPGAPPARFGSDVNKTVNISKIIAEPRTNSIIAMANAAGGEQLRDLINKLDTKNTSQSSGRIHVHYLNYGNAEELAKTLSSLVSNSQSSANRNTRGGRNFVAPGSDTEAIFSNDVKVTADKNNNALVVTAAPTDWLTLKNVINKLDIPRDQVYVEGMILETTIKRDRGFGIEFIGAYGKGNAQRGGFTTANSPLNGLLTTGNPTSLSGFFAGFGGPEKSPRTFKIAGQEVQVNSVNGLIQAIASNDSTNVLATPQILAMDNTEAEFQVGATIPVKVTTTASSGTTTTSVQNQEAKLTLKITPQINKVTRFVKLKINQSINDFSGALSLDGTGAATNTRSAVTEVMVRDRDTIAMGGLLRDKETSGESKVPLLGDIPVLGWLFKSTRKSVEKVNLLFFLTPKILSPYKTEAANHSITALEESTEHLRSGLNEDEPLPYKDKLDQLKAKLEYQAEGPLYNSASPNIYQNNNENEIEAVAPVEKEDESIETEEEMKQE